MPTMDDDVDEVLISQQELQERIHELGQQISVDYAGEDLLLVCVLKGAILFLADLMREITIPHAIDFMA
ncbi:MAG TPA: hypoxanthine phosphoribosyltransferase, partial [Anaerolineae bacterium]|nr:hypoxanthine phosphoribosyltransferase [Anaerolineae bacterium]